MRIRKGLLLALAWTLPGVSLAQGGAPGWERRLREDEDVKVKGLAGVMTYTGDAAALTAPGASYGVSVGLDFARFLGAELGYLGSVYNSEPLLIPDDRATIFENGGQALAKLRAGIGNLEPYAVGGLSITRLTVVDDAAVGGFIEDDTLFRLPLGVGVDFIIPSGNLADLTLGVRGVYQLGLGSGAFPTENNATATSQVMGMATIGGSW